MQKISDRTLLDKLKTEDSASFDLLYTFYFPSIASYIMHNMGNREDAEDIFQESVVVLLLKVRQPDFVLTSSLKTYLYAVAKNLWLKRLRDSKLIIFDEESPLTNQNISEDIPFEIHPEISEEEKVNDWLERITDNCKRILKAIYFFEEPMENLMIRMGWKNKHTANNQKYKCIQQVKNVKEQDKGA